MDRSTVIVSLILGIPTFASLILAVVSFIRSGKKEQSEVDLNKTEEQIAQERWWTDQINDLRGKLEKEQEKSEKYEEMARGFRQELNAIKDFLRYEHYPWDKQAKAQIEELHGHIEDPPIFKNGNGNARN